MYLEVNILRVLFLLLMSNEKHASAGSFLLAEILPVMRCTLISLFLRTCSSEYSRVKSFNAMRKSASRVDSCLKTADQYGKSS